ncbi:MAG: PIN domain-containing protein [Acidimicrobiales bacterium]|nr:PIN domain-containing protein [Acidimicrobiales bacterium]MCB9371809.1 PIN domain-containing protein [Microthrixaceae bacterium]
MARRRRRAQDPAPQRLILDAGAVIALARSDQRVRAVLAAAREARVHVSIPSVVVAETVRGVVADAPVNRVLTAVGEVDAADEAIGRTAGRLLGDAGSSSTVDAVVVATAVEAGGAVVLTGDPDDLSALAGEHREVVIEAF